LKAADRILVKRFAQGSTTVKRSVVVIDRDIRVLSYIRAILADRDCDLTTFDSGKHALECMRTGTHPRGVLLSTDLSDMDYVDLIRQVRRLNPHINIAVMSYLHRHGELVEAVCAGARQVLPKPFLVEDLLEAVAELLDETATVSDHGAVEVLIGQNMSMVYASRSMHEIRQQAALVARVNLPVLLLGESGTGKEVVARYIHSLSRQAQQSFLKVNCAAVPSELLESELFGYEPGAFTGAARSKPGKFKLCDGGTMFLDEIGEMHPSLQAKLLQVLQDGTFSPLGGRCTEKVTVRILAATNIDIKEAIANRTFREDLYYRLNGFCVNLPPLRERREDIPVLLRYFLNRYSHELGFSDVRPSLSTRLEKACVRYDWPGNLRELESFVKRYLVLGDERSMIDELTQELAEGSRRTEITPDLIQTALQAAGGNRRAAAKSLGISYKVLLHRMRQLGMEPGPAELCAV
jgi:two-component system, NtrC family, response regulator AtoC